MWNFHSYPWCELPVCLGLAYELHALPVMWPVKSWWGRGRDVVGRRMASWWNIGGCGFLLVDRVTNWTGFIIYLCWEQTSFGNSVFHLILINRVDPILCEVGDPKGELPVCVWSHTIHTCILQDLELPVGCICTCICIGLDVTYLFHLSVCLSVCVCV